MSHPAETSSQTGLLQWAPEMTSILHVVAPGAFGGIESVLRMLAAGQTELGHRVGIVGVLDAVEGPQPFEQSAEETGAEFIPLRIPSRRYLRERRALQELFAERAPEIVHTHGYRADVQGRAAARAARSVSVSTVHGFTGGDLKNRLFEKLQERSLARADAVVAVSGPIRDRLLRAGVPEGRMCVIPNAWSPLRALPRAEARARLGLPREGFVVGWVGRLSQEKGCDVFLQAMAALRDLPITACVIGEGACRSALEQASRTLALNDKVHWVGALENAFEVFAAFDALALSSHTEGTPMVLFEAMNAGVPIIATSVGGVPDVLGPEEAWLTLPARPDLLAGALRSSFNDPESGARRARAARQKLTDDYAVEPWLEAYDRVYRNAIDAHR